MANNGSGEGARAQLTMTNDWRAAEGVNDVVKRFPPFEKVDAVKKAYPHYFHGRDNHGRQVRRFRTVSPDDTASVPSGLRFLVAKGCVMMLSRQSPVDRSIETHTT